MKKLSRKRKLFYFLLIILIIGLLLPENLKMPVIGATKNDYHPESFWYYPWGKSVTHKGVDIFGTRGKPIVSTTKGLVLYSGKIRMGGNIVIVLGPKWRIHYYAHLDQNKARPLSFVGQNTIIGTMGSTGNAAGKQPHLHYTIFSLLPHIWRVDNSKQGWKKMFYLNPIDKFSE